MITQLLFIDKATHSVGGGGVRPCYLHSFDQPVFQPCPDTQNRLNTRAPPPPSDTDTETPTNIKFMFCVYDMCYGVIVFWRARTSSVDVSVAGVLL